MPSQADYTYRVEWSGEDREYVGLCPRFRRLSFLAPTPEAALAGIRESVAIALEMLSEDGQHPPSPAPRARVSRPRELAHA